MSLSRGLCIATSLGLLLASNYAFADGHGRGPGFNRALSAAARGAGNSGLARTSQSATRSPSGLSRNGANLGRSANGLNRASNGMTHSQALTAQTSNAARIRDHRLEQAGHLREISARNGNTHLLDTADRMQNSAETNFNRRTGETNSSEQIPDADDGAADIATPAAPVQPPKNPRSSWLPSWLRTSR